jgi:hypothetical protein
MQLQTEPKSTGRVVFDVGRTHPISRIFGIGADTLVGVHQNAVQDAIAALKAKQETRWGYLSHFLSEFHEELPQRLVELGTECANKQHMLLFTWKPLRSVWLSKC